MPRQKQRRSHSRRSPRCDRSFAVREWLRPPLLHCSSSRPFRGPEASCSPKRKLECVCEHATIPARRTNDHILTSASSASVFAFALASSIEKPATSIPNAVLSFFTSRSTTLIFSYRGSAKYL